MFIIIKPVYNYVFLSTVPNKTNFQEKYIYPLTEGLFFLNFRTKNQLAEKRAQTFTMTEKRAISGEKRRTDRGREGKETVKLSWGEA